MPYLLITSLIWAFSYGLIKTNLTAIDPNFVSFCRMAFALPLFLPFLKINQLHWKNSLILMSTGAIQYGLMYLFFIRSFQYLNAHQVALFTTLTPLYLIFFNQLATKKFTLYYSLMALLAVLGGILIYYQYADVKNIWRGFLYVQLADVCFALGQIAYKHFRRTHPAINDKDIYALLFLGAFLVAGFATTYFGAWHSFQSMTWHQLMVLIYLGTISSGICFFWWNKGAHQVNVGTLAAFNNLKAPLAVFISLIFFHEQTELLRLFAGLGLMSLAIFLSEKHNRKNSDRV